MPGVPPALPLAEGGSVAYDSFAAGYLLLRDSAAGTRAGEHRGRCVRAQNGGVRAWAPRRMGVFKRGLAERRCAGDWDLSAFCFVVGFLNKLRRKCNKDS